MIGLIVLACCLGVLFSYIPIFQHNERLREKILGLEKQVAIEEARLKALETAIRNLREDPKTVERLAREKLGYAKPGETIIYFEPARTADPRVH